MSMVGKKVMVRYIPSWPIPQATYTYEGFDEKGHWVRRADGVQRHLTFDIVAEITPVETAGEVEEGEF